MSLNRVRETSNRVKSRNSYYCCFVLVVVCSLGGEERSEIHMIQNIKRVEPKSRRTESCQIAEIHILLDPSKQCL